MRQPARWAIVVASVLGLGVILLALVVGIPAMKHRLTYGTLSTQGPPPRVDYCGRRYYPGSGTQSLHQVEDFLARNQLSRLTQVGTTPSGMPVLAQVMSPATTASDHTEVCAMAVWVKTGPDRYLSYALSGGP